LDFEKFRFCQKQTKLVPKCVWQKMAAVSEDTRKNEKVPPLFAVGSRSKSHSVRFLRFHIQQK